MARVKVVKWADEPEGKKKIKKQKVKSIRKIRNPKLKPKKKAVIPIGPKLRLEPRISPKINKNQQDNVKENEIQPMFNSQNSGNLITRNISAEGIILPDTIQFEFGSTDVVPEMSGTSSDNTYRSVRNKIDILKSTPVATPPISSYSTRMQWKLRRTKTKMHKGRFWHDRELINLAMGLQMYGFNDTKKLAEVIKTKNENQIKEYIRLRSVEVRAEINADVPVDETPSDADTDTEPCKGRRKKKPVKRKGRPRNKWSKVSPAHLPTWPNVRKWRRLTFDQMLACCRAKDFSKRILPSLIQQFYDEEEEPSDPQVINVKAVYKYLLDCVAGEIPAQLAPKESALVMDLLRDLRLLPMVYDFDEETKFLESYKGATRYRPFEVKEEFKKKYVIKTENMDDGFNPNCVSVPEEVFTNLSRHKRVVQNFNPLMIPVWMMQKEQEYMEQFV